jgi:hypothetical protein
MPVKSAGNLVSATSCGSIRKASNRVRISGEVIDVMTGGPIWADRYEGALEDVFGPQDNITSSVIPAIAPKVLHVEIARAQAKPTSSLTAYDLYLRAVAFVFEQKLEALEPGSGPSRPNRG